MTINRKYILTFFLGALLTTAGILFFKMLFDKKEEQVNNDYYVITNQIRKMNKMVVMEQDFSSIQKTKMTSELLGGGLLPAMEKEIISFTKTNAQVSYDLNKMQIEVDSVQRKLILKTLPQPEIRIIPSVEIQSMDDSFFNRIDEGDIKKITSSAKQNAVKSVNQPRLKAEGQKQLMQNLQQIFVLAKALNYKIEDQTGTLDPNQL